ncbi:DUF3866 family protein [Sanguibacter keddieii]|nr:DUF3866 family protein [Sanguibacter keddieii]
MMTWRGARILSTGTAWDGALELTVQTDPVDSDVPGAGPQHTQSTLRALAYPALVGPTTVGDHVLLNTTALDRGLGTGGYALVVAVLPRDGQPVAASPRTDGPGHLVKARYTPHQTMVLGVDEQESPHHSTLQDADDLGGMPVVVADLHSALPAIVAGARHHAQTHGRRTPRIVYVMTDGGALPAWFSRTVARLRDTGWTAATITVGQAYGGDHEAVTVHTGLLAAHHVLDADLAVVTQGPGNLGTGTRWGFSGVAAGEAVNAAATLGGRPVASLRVSGADARERHQGISHHSLTAYGRVALLPADVPVPRLDQVADRFDAAGHDPLALDARIQQQAPRLAAGPARHTLVEAPATPDLADALALSPVRLSTMGRGLDQDPAAFLAAAVAGQHAASLLT